MIDAVLRAREDEMTTKEDAEASLAYAREHLIEAVWGWLVARPQRSDGEAAVSALETFFDARESVKATLGREHLVTCAAYHDSDKTCDGGCPPRA